MLDRRDDGAIHSLLYLATKHGKWKMELKYFIAETMVGIVRGIKKGQHSGVGDHIAPLIQREPRQTGRHPPLTSQSSLSCKDSQKHGEARDVSGGEARAGVASARDATRVKARVRKVTSQKVGI